MAPRPKLTPEQERQICDRYQAKEPMQQLADEYHVCAGTIKNILSRHGIDRTANFRNLTVEEIEEVRRRFREGENSYQLAAAFGVSRPAISAHLRSEKKQKRSRGEHLRRYRCNENYFATIDTPEKAYALGFIVTDGCINATYSSTPELTIVLSAKDTDHLHTISTLLESDRPVRVYRHGGYEFARFAIRSKKITDDLARFGVSQRKTFTIGWPDLCPDLYRHFLRGVFDGDGCALVTRQGRQVTPHLNIHLIANQHIATSALAYVRQACGLPEVTLSPRFQKNGELSTLSFRYAGNARCLPIVNLLYEDATVYLPRKRQLILDHYRALPKYRDQLRFGVP